MTPDACPEHVGLIARAADGSLDDDARARLEHHAARCAACRTALDEQRAVRRLLARRESVGAPLGFAARVMGAIERDAPAAWWDRVDFRRWTWRVAPITAGLALVAWLSSAGAATTTADTSDEATGASPAVSTAWLSDEATPADAMSLMLFADPDASLDAAMQEIPR